MKRIGKILGMAVLTLIVTGNAWAFSSFTWHLDTIGYTYTNAFGSGNTLNFSELLNITNAGNFPAKSTITQNLGADGILSNGDTFTEFGGLNVVGADSEATFFTSSGAPARIYYEFSGLSGWVDNVNLSDPAKPVYDIHFNPGVGSIDLLYTDDLTLATSDGVLASFDLLKAGATGFTLAEGAGLNGGFSFTIGFQNVLNGFWQFPMGYAEDILAALGPDSIKGYADMNANILKGGIVPTSNNALLITVENSGTIRHAVPEPSTMFLLGVGILGLGAFARRRA